MRSVLSQEECAAADRLRQAEDRSTYIAAHALLRCHLSAFVERSPQSWQIGSTPEGAPRLIDREEGDRLSFSLTHTKCLAACVVAPGYPVGIDAEPIDRRLPELSVLEAILAPEELAMVLAAEDDDRAESFYRLWTLREAYAKAIGTGITYPRESFSFSLEPPAIQPADDAWQFESWRQGGHVLALAVRPPPGQQVKLAYRRMTPGELPLEQT